MSASSAAAAPRPDGRHRRRERSRRAVVSATLALVREHGRLPSMSDVATRAGLTERTVFNLFGDKGLLTRAVLDAYRAEALASLPPVPQHDELEPRVRLFFEALSGFLEDYARVRWAALASRTDVPDMGRGVVLGALLERVLDVLGGPALRDRCDSAQLAALAAAVDPTTWRLYRVQQGLDPARSREAMVGMVLAITRAW